jgi:hypothetical protein
MGKRWRKIQVIVRNGQNPFVVAQDYTHCPECKKTLNNYWECEKCKLYLTFEQEEIK